MVTEILLAAVANTTTNTATQNGLDIRDLEFLISFFCMPLHEHCVINV